MPGKQLQLLIDKICQKVPLCVLCLLLKFCRKLASIVNEAPVLDLEYAKLV
jgi:hypothetical protein